MRTRTRLAALAVLLCVASPLYSQEAEPDPMLGGYVLGNSAELIQIYMPYDSLVQRDVDLRIIDFDTAASKLDTTFSSHPYASEPSFLGPKQMDVATGDFNADGRDDIVVAFQDSGNTITLVIPEITKGALDWSSSLITRLDTDTLFHDSPLTSRGYFGISGIRLVAGDFDAAPGQEFVLGYVTPDSQIQLSLFKTDSLLTSFVPVASALDTTRCLIPPAWYYENEWGDRRHHCFDMAAGDFDGDWLDELLLVGEHGAVGDGQYTLFASIYELSTSVLEQRGYDSSVLEPYGRHVIDRIAVVAGRFSGWDREQVMFAVHAQDYKTSSHTWDVADAHYSAIYRLAISATLDTMEYAKVRDLGANPWRIGEYTHYTGALSLCAGDLNADGGDELVFKGGKWLYVYQVNPDLSVAHVGTAGMDPANGWFDKESDSRRELMIADLDADTSQGTWRPEIISMHRRVNINPGWYFAVYDANTNPSNEITGVSLRSETKLTDRPGPLVFAAGDFDGDGIRLGKPSHHSFTHTGEPMVVLNSPPIHFDLLLDDTIPENDTLDVIGFWTLGNIDDSVSYSTSGTETECFGSTHATDWNVSASVGTKAEGLGFKISAKLTATYGESSSRFSGSTETVFTSTGTEVAGGDRARAETVPYDVWEYPIYVSGEMQGYHVVANPKQGLIGPFWDAPQYFPAESYRPQHEVGMILSYPRDEAELMKRGDVDTILAVFDSWTVRAPGDAGAARIGQDYGVEQFTNDESSRTRSASIDLEAEAEGYGLTVAASGHYGTEQVETRSSAIGSGFQFRTTLSTIQNQFSPYAYNVSPVSYWNRSGALVIDYIVEPLEGGNSWWTRDYGSTPDPAFLLPWRYHDAKGVPVGEPTQYYRCPELYFQPYRPDAGDVATVHGRVHNYSLDSLDEDVEVWFYSGDPSCSETTPLYNTAGDSAITISGGIGARTFQDFEFEWEVPLGAPANARVWVVLDPEDAVAEIHDNNNMAWVGVFVDNPAVQTCTPACPIVMTGDVNEDGALTASDIITMVNFIFKGGPAPLPCEAAGDVGSDGTCTAADIIYLVNHVFKGGAAPLDVCDVIPGLWTCP